MINGVVGVIIWTEDLERLLTFYQRLLSCEPYSIRPDFVWFKWGSMRFGIGKHSEVIGKAIDPVRIFINLGVDEMVNMIACYSRELRFLGSLKKNTGVVG